MNNESRIKNQENKFCKIKLASYFELIFLIIPYLNKQKTLRNRSVFYIRVQSITV